MKEHEPLLLVNEADGKKRNERIPFRIVVIFLIGEAVVVCLVAFGLGIYARRLFR